VPFFSKWLAYMCPLCIDKSFVLWWRLAAEPVRQTSRLGDNYVPLTEYLVLEAHLAFHSHTHRQMGLEGWKWAAIDRNRHKLDPEA